MQSADLKTFYLGVQCKKDLFRRSMQKGTISAFSARRFYIGVKFETTITIIKENLHPSIRRIRMQEINAVVRYEKYDYLNDFNRK